ncbi:MAG: beta-N-acetylhexosaminidase [Alphaproteobacteria bacterium]
MPDPSLSRLVVTGLDGPRLDARSRRRLERLAPGGVILFRRNVVDPEQVRALTREVRAVLGPRAIVSLDQEGGRVQRLRAPFGEWPPMRRIGAAGSTALSREVGRALGREVAAAGFDCDFAPVLDVDSNPSNPVIGDRSFHRDPATAARLALAFAAGLRDAGVIACGKHFPGHGDTELDSHLALPVVRRSARVLDRVELAPFRAAIRARLPMLMTAHVVYTALDPDLPATLSPAILRDLLRDRLRFRGVVVSDDLGMHALDAFGPLADRGAAAISAGCDLLLACGSLDQG